jgi:hypothetical protein
LVQRLEEAGHQVVTPALADTTGRADEVHFRHAADSGLILVTKNPDDILAFHDTDAKHAGILLIYQDNDPARDMSAADVVRAIANLESAGISLPGTVQVLNAWRY